MDQVSRRTPIVVKFNTTPTNVPTTTTTKHRQQQGAEPKQSTDSLNKNKRKSASSVHGSKTSLKSRTASGSNRIESDLRKCIEVSEAVATSSPIKLPKSKKTNSSHSVKSNRNSQSVEFYAI